MVTDQAILITMSHSIVFNEENILSSVFSFESRQGSNRDMHVVNQVEPVKNRMNRSHAFLVCLVVLIDPSLYLFFV